MAEITIYTFAGLGGMDDEDSAICVRYAYTVEAQRTTRIASRADDVAIRRLTMDYGDPPEGVSAPMWISALAAIERLFNALITARPAAQEALEAAAREAWDAGNVKIVSITQDNT